MTGQVRKRENKVQSSSDIHSPHLENYIPEQRAVTIPGPLWYELMLFLFSDSGMVAWNNGTQRIWEIWRTAKIAKEGEEFSKR